MIPKIVAAVQNPSAVLYKILDRIDFTEYVSMQKAKKQGLLSGVGCVIDAGAHHGNCALALARILPGAQIHCFEPVPETYEILSRRTAGFPTIVNHCAALGSCSQRAQLNVSKLDQASSILEMDGNHTRLWPSSEVARKIDVPLITVDQFLGTREVKGMIFLKMDVQGYEMEILKGAASSLERVSIVRFEASFKRLYQNSPLFSDVCSYLEHRGFRFAGIATEILAQGEKLPVQADILYVRA
jgi:FkbM family methyltransferase